MQPTRRSTWLSAFANWQWDRQQLRNFSPDGIIFKTAPFTYNSPPFFNLSPAGANETRLEIMLTNTLLVDSDTTLINLQSCNPADTGTVVQNLTGQTGCDSIIITTTTLHLKGEVMLMR